MQFLFQKHRDFLCGTPSVFVITLFKFCNETLPPILKRNITADSPIVFSMDSAFWASRLAAAKRQCILQHHTQSSHLDRFNLDGFEVGEEVPPDLPCPYCYEDFDVASLCSHLEEEHSRESGATVCPVCSVKVVRDMLSHITIQHGHLFKLQRRRRLRRVAIPNSQTFSLLARDLREAHLQVLLGGGGFRSNTTSSSTAAATTDPLLSSLVLNFHSSEAEEISKSVVTNVDDSPAKNALPTNMWKSSYEASLSYEERKKRMQQANGRAVFIQDLVLSALLED